MKLEAPTSNSKDHFRRFFKRPLLAMAKEKSTDKEERKKEKKEKREKRSEKDGVHKSKKDKKEKKVTSDAPVSIVTAALLENLENMKHKTETTEANGIDEAKVKVAPLLGALVPFANPLADEKTCKKVLKSVKKGIASTLFPICCSPY